MFTDAIILAENMHHKYQFSLATHQFHTIQHYLPLFLLLLYFSSLQLLSVGYTIPDKYFINCGSNTNVTESGRVYVGESNPLVRFSCGSKTETNQSSVPSPLYQTARIFRRQSSYEFRIDTDGTYMVRLHFLAFSSPSNLPSAKFNVSAPSFMLLQNFEAKNYTNSVLVKEFFINITVGSFSIIFAPLPTSFAFVNAIELFILPGYLIADAVSRVSGELSTYSGVLSRVLETKHRLNVGGHNIPRGQDPLLRSWFSDDAYLVNPQNAKNSTPYYGNITYQVGDDSDGPNATRYTAPVVVYETAKEINDTTKNITWGLPVDKNIDHLVRVHFCDIWNMKVGLTVFNLYINDQIGLYINNDTSVSTQLPAPYYYDLLVQSDDSGLMTISVQPLQSVPVPNAFLNGLEIMKLINSSDFGPLADQSNCKHSLLPVVLGSAIGGLVLISLAVVGFVWCLKIRKQKPFENSHRLPIPPTAGGSSHSILTEGSISLGLKISLHDLQLATKNFDDKLIIGSGGFGNVYKGILKNGMRVAVKRSKPGSCQGLPEFQTEIMVLSKIRHKNLVSLIGYCDEMCEMILVYEYMEKGTLRDHLYHTNMPSLSWKQRLEICIGSARGLHYLHKGAPGGIIHRDVKSTNILLDENHVAHVSDFGLSRIGPLDHQAYVSTDVKGTFGYLDPEYFRTEKLTEKSDVYSFGVVLLEVLCARPAIDPSLPREQVNLADWGILCKNKGTLEAIIDPSIKDQIDQNSLRKFSETVEKCLQEYGSKRPTMGDVMWDMEFALQLHRGSTHREPHKDSSSGASASLQLPIVRRLPSSSTLNEVDELSIVRGDESDSAADAVISQLKK